MAVFCKLLKFTNRCEYAKKIVISSTNLSLRNFCTIVQEPRSKGTKSILKFSLIGAGLGILVGAGYSFNQISKARQNLALEGTQVEKKLLDEKPPISVSRRVSQ